MKIIYLINSKDYSYHKKIVLDFISITGGEAIETSGANLGIQYYEIERLLPDLIITFDLAGHVFRTGSDTLSLNNIYARFAHILFRHYDHYGPALKARQNLSMFTFIPASEDVGSYRKRFEEIPNIETFVSINYKPSDENERKNNLANIEIWWNEFKKEAML